MGNRTVKGSITHTFVNGYREKPSIIHLMVEDHTVPDFSHSAHYKLTQKHTL